MTRSIAGLAAALVAVCCFFLGLAFADDKTPAPMPKCAYCKAVKDVTAHMRCAACAKADKPCDRCAAMAKEVATTAACSPCKDGKGCDECSSVMKQKGECEFCAEKKAVAERSYCCMNCAGAKKTDCPECQTLREAVMAIPCEECAKAGKK